MPLTYAERVSTVTGMLLAGHQLKKFGLWNEERTVFTEYYRKGFGFYNHPGYLLFGRFTNLLITCVVAVIVFRTSVSRLRANY